MTKEQEPIGFLGKAIKNSMELPGEVVTIQEATMEFEGREDSLQIFSSGDEKPSFIESGSLNCIHNE